MGHTESALRMRERDNDRAERNYSIARQEALNAAWETVRVGSLLKQHLDNEWMAHYLAEICQCLPFAESEVDGLDKPNLQVLVKVCAAFEKELIKYVAGEE